ncbi:MAG: type IX secretion system protein PorQ [Bacteroidales bacterium]|nr:type IX secretion system protein PorQ [Bacteroidales bacterium]
MKLLKKIYTLGVFLLLFAFNSEAQTGGDNTFEFLNIPPTARLSSLGGNNVSIFDYDPSLVYANPALMHSYMDNMLHLSYNNYIADINFAYASYIKDFENIGTFGGSIYFLNYGKFIHADETGAILGNFTASDYVFDVSYNRPLMERLYAGASLKFIYSSMFTYFSSGLAADLGLHYFSGDSLFSAGLAFKNLGSQLKPYYLGNYEHLPYDLQIGFTQGLKHAPFRFSLTFQDLLNWNLRYDSPLDQNYYTDINQSQSDSLNFTQKVNNFFNSAGKAGDELLRHAIVGVEIVPSENFYISLGFNYRRRAELAISTKPGLIGFSIGAGVKVSKFHISYGFANYHIAGKSHLVSLSTNLNSFYRKS